MKKIFSLFTLISFTLLSYSQNPLVMNQFTADPSARVFDGKVYIYPSHDIPCGQGQGFIGFCMADYHVFSSSNLTDWEDHGVILSQNDVEWADTAAYGMWAPDCIYRNGKYYFYFPAVEKNKKEGKARAYKVGVAVSVSPTGPFVPEPLPIGGVVGIDPNPFIDKDGQAYLYWGGGENISMARLKDNMLELATEPQKVLNLPDKFKEGPYLFERNGIYYFTFPYVPETTEQLVYAMGDNPMGPFTYKGVIMDEWPNKCWTNHHSIIQYNEQDYLFYHHNDLSPGFDKNRSIRADSLFFNEDGSIQKVIPSLRGVGISNSGNKIQPDRYSAISEQGVSITFIDSLTTMEGWKVKLEKKDAWVRYNRVDLGDPALEKVVVKARSTGESKFEIRLNTVDGKTLAEITTGKSKEWTMVSKQLEKFQPGIYDLFIVAKTSVPVEIDWVKFE